MSSPSTTSPTSNRAFFAEQFLITEDNVADFLAPETDPADFECDNVFNRVAGSAVVTVTSPAEDVDVVAARPQPRRGVSFRDAGPPIALVVIFAGLLGAELRSSARIGNVQNILDAAAVLAVVTCGITFVLMMGSIDLSAAGVMGASAHRGGAAGGEQPQRQRPRAPRDR